MPSKPILIAIGVLTVVVAALHAVGGEARGDVTSLTLMSFAVAAFSGPVR